MNFLCYRISSGQTNQPNIQSLEIKEAKCSSVLKQFLESQAYQTGGIALTLVLSVFGRQSGEWRRTTKCRRRRVAVKAQLANQVQRLKQKELKAPRCYVRSKAQAYSTGLVPANTALFDKDLLTWKEMYTLIEKCYKD